jgi:hypothetical protein
MGITGSRRAIASRKAKAQVSAALMAKPDLDGEQSKQPVAKATKASKKKR